jgi:hypothetical protein
MVFFIMKVFLLAHQDDEIFLIPYLFTPEKKLFVYLTTGVVLKSPVEQVRDRNLEARLMFDKKLASQNAQVVWWGLEKLISDGELYRHINEENVNSVLSAIENFREPVNEILTTTFEGAHQDHDAAAVLSRILARRMNIQVTEISTYPQLFSWIYSFRILRPRVRLEEQRLHRFRTLALAINLMTGYKSQRKTWLGLGPGVLFAYAFRKYYSSSPQPVGMLKLCFYEYRGRASQAEVLSELFSNIEISKDI